MPRRVRVRAVQRRPAVDVDAAVIASLIDGELPAWLAEFLLHRDHPRDGSAEARLLEKLSADPVTAPHEGLWHRSPLAAIWKAHRAALMARWAAEERKGRPWGVVMEIDPLNPDPRDALFDRPRH